MTISETIDHLQIRMSSIQNHLDRWALARQIYAHTGISSMAEDGQLGLSTRAPIGPI